jgi:hypothetical protein
MQKILPIAALIKLATDSSEQIWHAVERQRLLPAVMLYKVANMIQIYFEKEADAALQRRLKVRRNLTSADFIPELM